jgi:DNA-binding GntR family transcriptional regulator
VADLLHIPKEEQLSLKERVYHRLKKAIVEGVFPAGSKLVESDLAERLQVSRTPVREALQVLAREGLVTILPRRGVIVESLTMRDVEDVFLMREVLEGLAAALSAQRISSAELKELREAWAMSCEAKETGDFERAIEANTLFHSAICKAAKSDRLTQLLGMVLDQIATYRNITLTDAGRRNNAFDEHARILSAIEEGDPEAAENQMRIHISNAREMCLTVLKEQSAKK